MNDFVKKLKKAYEKPEDYRLIERLVEYHDLPHKLHEAKGETKNLVIIDTETTGFDVIKDEIIQLAMIHITVDVDFGRVVSINRSFNELNEPTIAQISDKITEITGITKDMVVGKNIDSLQVQEFLGDKKDTYIIAHNAKFDYRFMMNGFDFMDSYAWGCSMMDIDWRGIGLESTKLEYITFRNGYFYDGHNALTDCFAVLGLLVNNTGAIESLVSNLVEEKYILSAIGAPFDIKDQLKENGFRWNSENKVWFKSDMIREEVSETLEVTKKLYDPEMERVSVKKQKGNRRFEK